MAKKESFLTKALATVAGTLGFNVVSKADQQMANESMGRIKAVSLNAASYGRNNLDEIQKKGISKP